MLSQKITGGDLVDVVTGSYYLPTTDLILPDIHQSFKISRKYESVIKRVGVLGKGWIANFETKLYLEEDKIHLLCQDGHMEIFDKQEAFYDEEYTIKTQYIMVEGYMTWITFLL